jgi:acyl-ACP thioesterase
MSEVLIKWQKTFKINSYHVDTFQRLTLPSLCLFFQEIAYEHAEHLNFGYNYLKSLKKFWVLSRLHVEVYRYPVWGDEVTVTTWPRGMDGMFALREFLVNLADGTQIAAATSSWLVLDEEKHFPQRIDPDDFVEFSKTKETALNLVAEKLPKVDDAFKVETFKVKYSDVDVNRHVNNGRYVQWAIDSLPLDNLLNRTISSLLVNFMGEASFEDIIALWKTDHSDSGYHVFIHNDSRTKELCRVRLQLSDRL